MKQRILGFDLARSLAVLGMVIVNFKIAMNAVSGNQLLQTVAAGFEGRASALFVVLAGVGVTFLTARAVNSEDLHQIRRARKILLKRGLLLVLIGLSYTVIWPADILHFYGFYFLVAAMLFIVRDRVLLLWAMLVTVLFPLLMLVYDYQQGWDWENLHYQGFWTAEGMARRIIFNGFHPVLPWCSFLLLGMWLGRQDFNSASVRKNLLKISLITWALTELIFTLIRFFLANNKILNLPLEHINFLFSTSIIPPLPQYMLAAGSLAVALIVVCLNTGERFNDSVLIQTLSKTGQLSLTIYIAHVLIGMGALESVGILYDQTIEVSLLSALGFYLAAVLFSVCWLKYFRIGPIEWVFREFSR